MIIDHSDIERIYTQLGDMDVVLDSDPIEFGPSRLNNKTAQVRKYLSDTEKVFMEVSQNLHKYKRDLLMAETEYQLAQTQLMVDDPHVRAGRSQQEREAIASTKLVSVQTRINDFRLAVHDLDDLLKVIKAKRTDLKDIQGRLKDQLKLCQEQINLGPRWGSKIDVSIYGDTSSDDVLIKADPSVRQTPSFEEEDISTSRIVEQVLQQEPKTSFTEKFKPTASSDDVSSFLDDRTPLQKVDLTKVESLDLDDILKDFS
jgi:hypothetical protein